MLKRGINHAKESVRRVFHTTAPSIGVAPPVDPLSGSAALPSSKLSAEDFTTEIPPFAIGACLTETNTTTHIPDRSPSKHDTKQVPWARINTLMNVLAQTSEFGPLKTTLENLINGIKTLDNQRNNNKEYVQLRTELDVLLSDLSSHFAEGVPPTMTDCMASLIGAINRELVMVQQKTERSAAKKYLMTGDDIEELISCYRRIQGLLMRFAMNANAKMWRTLDEIATDHNLDRLPNSPAGYYRSAESDSLGRRGCTPNTRAQVLQNLTEWANDSTCEKIYWLNGMAGTGKTTIAYSLCDILDGTSQLGASFFCSRRMPLCRDINRIIPSIAYQLSLFSLPFRYVLSRALDRKKDAHNRPISDQFVHLILTPLQEIADTLPINTVIVIDALDECDDKDGVRRILNVLLLHGPDLLVKFFVTSRPDSTIVEQMWNNSTADRKLELRLHELDRVTVEHDIMAYLGAELENLGLSDIDLRKLAKRSGVLFIYAATAARYIIEGGHLKSFKRMTLVLEASAASPSSHEKHIDDLYTAILDAAYDDPSLDDSDRDEMVSILHTVICAREPLSINCISALLGMSVAASVKSSLRHFLSVLSISEESEIITALHESFPDYILSQTRSRRFSCDTSRVHTNLSKSCFNLIQISSPPFNICHLESSYVLDQDVPDLEERVNGQIPKSLNYACRYWSAHLMLASPVDGLQGLLHDFLSERLLLWIEILNLIKQIHHGARMLYALYKWCTKLSEYSDELQLLIQDAHRFMVMISTSPITQSTPHIYLSALMFWPNYRPVKRIYATRLPGTIFISGKAVERRELPPITLYNGQGRIDCVVFSPDCSHIFFGFHSGLLCIWDLQSGRMIGDLIKGHARAISSISCCTNKAYIATGSQDRTIRIWDIHTGESVGQRLSGHTDFVSSVVYSPDGNSIASGSWDRTIRIWDADNQMLRISPMFGHTDQVSSVSYSPDGKYIVSGSHDCTIRIWDSRTGQLVGNPLHNNARWVRSVTYYPDGKRIISCSADGSVLIWDLQAEVAVQEPFFSDNGPVGSVSFSADGAYMAFISWDNIAFTRDTRTSESMVLSPQGHSNRVLSIAYSLDGFHVAYTSSDTTIHIWDPQYLDNLRLHPLEGHADAITSVAYSSDGTRLISCSIDKTIRLWDAVTGQMIGRPFIGHTGRVNSVAFSPGGLRFVSASDDRTLRIWDVCTGELAGRILQGHTDGIKGVAYSPHNNLIASCSTDRTIRIWDAHECLAFGNPFEGHSKSVTSVSFSPEGTHVVSGSADSTIRIWDISTAQTIGIVLQGHSDTVRSVTYSLDGAYLLSSSWDKTIRIWDAKTGQPIGNPLEGHTNSVMSAVFSPDGACIVSGSLDGTIRVWDRYTRKAVGQPLLGHTHGVYCVSYSPDGTRLVSCSGDQTIRIWDASGFGGLNESIRPKLPDCVTWSNDVLIPEIRRRVSIAKPYDNWELDEYGWVTENGRLLIWVPPDLRPLLLRYPNTEIIGRRGSLHLNFLNAPIGKNWQQFYTATTDVGL